MSSEEVEKRIKDKLSSRRIGEWDAQLILKSYSRVSDFPIIAGFIDFCADNGWGVVANDIADAFCSAKGDEDLWGALEKYTEKFLKKSSDWSSFPTDAAKALIMTKNLPHVRRKVERFLENCLPLSDIPEALVLLKDSSTLLEKICIFLENTELYGSAIGIAQAYLLVENDPAGVDHVDKSLSKNEHGMAAGSYNALDAAKDYIFLKKFESLNGNLNRLTEELNKKDDNYSKAMLKGIGDVAKRKSRYYHTTADGRSIEEIREQILDEAADKKELKELTELFSHVDYRSFFENTEAIKNVLNTLKSLGIANWDDKNYARTYWTNKKKEETFVKMERDLYSTVGNVVNEILDGDLFYSIRNNIEGVVEDKKLEELNMKKTVVTTEIKAYKERGDQPPKELLEEIWGISRELKEMNKAYQGRLNEEKNRARKLKVFEIKERLGHVISGISNGSAKREQVIFLMDQLKNEYLEEGTKGYSKVNEILELIPRGEMLKDQIKTEIWSRNPWIDLSYGEEFYCCTAAGEMHQKAAISYMRNPAITMLDFHHPTLGRCMRAFLLAAVDKKNRPFLVIDSVEGTDRVDFDVVKRTIEDYASHAGFGFVLYNKKVVNSTPRKFIESISSENKVAEIYLSVLYGTDEYLEAFPIKSEKPEGKVKGYLVKLD